MIPVSPFLPDTKEQSMEEGIPSSTTSNRQLRHAESSRLSIVSKQYDIRGEGHLDETEQKMRAMDTRRTRICFQ